MATKSILIATKLRLLSVVGIVSIILIGSIGIYQLSLVDSVSRDIRSNWMPGIQFLGEANAALANHRMKTYKHVTLTDLAKMSVEEAEMEKLLAEAQRNLDSYRPLTFTDFEKSEFKIVEEHLVNYVSINSTIIGLSRQNLYDSARAIIYSTSFEQYTSVNKTIKKLLAFNIEQSQLASAKSESIFKNAVGITIALLLVGSLAMLGMGQWILKGIKNQLNYLKSVFEKLSLGDMTVSLNTDSSDEIGQLSKDISQVINNLQSAAGFSRKIGEGDLNSQLQVLSSQDVLGISLTNMQNQLKAVAEEDRKRNWATEGLARLGDILRAQHENSQTMYDQLIKFVVNYSDSLQGGLFLASDTDDETIDLAACYAYDRKKYIEKKIQAGEGLVGQVYLEKMTCYLLDIPQNYLSITSGLGGANPSVLLIVPMKIEEKVVGIIEIASFKPLEKYRIEFVEKLADSIAAAVASVKINEKTKVLLHTSLQQTEELRAQEEEVRQNLEEMTATQEEMNRKTFEFQSRLELISNSHIGTIEFDLNGTILDANRGFLDVMGYGHAEEIVGKHHRIFVTPDFSQSRSYAEFWSNLGRGVTRFGEFTRIKKDGTPITLHCNYDVIRDGHGKPIKVMKVAIDISKMKLYAAPELANGSSHA